MKMKTSKCFLWENFLFDLTPLFPPFSCVSKTTLQRKETEARITRGGTIAPTMAAYVLLSTQAPSYFHLSEFIGTPDLCKLAFSERSSWSHGGIFNQGSLLHQKGQRDNKRSSTKIMSRFKQRFQLLNIIICFGGKSSSSKLALGSYLCGHDWLFQMEM